jgi:nucleoside-diphosphate-sugar epimerase
MSDNTILIAGASGLAGGAAVRLFASRPGWRVIAVSRRLPLLFPDNATHVPVDLMDTERCRDVFGRMGDVTHVVYAAVNEMQGAMVAGWQDAAQAARNMAMLRNLLDPLLAAATDLRHVSLVHGLKAYGSHLWDRVAPLPYRESLPRVPHENFYYQQEDYVAARQAGRDWAWTVLRPAMIAGEAIGSNMNSYLVLAVFAALRREAGLDLPCPAGTSMVTDVADADLIALGLEWAATAPAARNEIFNLVNGDIFSLHDAFPIVADCFGMRLGPRQPYDIVTELKALAHLWPGMVRRHALRSPEDLGALFGESLEVGGSWTADIAPADVLRYGLASTIKIRKAGFHHCVDTAGMVAKYMRRYQELRLVPSTA